ncbi:hypothetical protein ElyMa_003493400 [Elysia marginata]|uniref:Uncharacterized protein n=1 Tax=Elysia marginata TaxID=1093978 RepID=A0AAV4EDC5_9GAST|nr:hypothetical protein ElyMa_003493400 [Elysia marginata]
MLGRSIEKSNCQATVSRVSTFQVYIGQAVFDLMGNLADVAVVVVAAAAAVEVVVVVVVIVMVMVDSW